MASNFDAFHALVVDDPAMQERLRRQTAWATFAELALRVAEDRGYSLSVGELEDARRTARRAWLERRL